MKRILVTGGAGYIGAHIVWQLLERGHFVAVLDNLQSGRLDSVPARAEFQQGNIADEELVKRVLHTQRIDAVIHCAADISVAESMQDPSRYYRNNVSGSLNLFTACLDSGVNHLVFSSSAAVYGIPKQNPIAENAVCAPINPYGTSKMVVEWMLRDVAAANRKFRFVALRYFNVAGARMDGKLGQHGAESTHLIKVCCQVACQTAQKKGMLKSKSKSKAEMPEMNIFGDDYPTADGTCVRDYIHVEDLADAHLRALEYLGGGGASIVLNCGYRHGYSVRQVVECVKKVSKVDFAVSVGVRRRGDPPELVADNALIRRHFAWKPKYDDLSAICRSAYQWEQTLSKGA